MSAIRRVKLVPTGGKDLRQLIVLRVALVSYALEQSTPDLHDQQKRSSSDALIAPRLCGAPGDRPGERHGQLCGRAEDV